MATVLRAHDYIRPVDTTASAEAKSAEPERPSAGTHNPYLAARREWDERYGKESLKDSRAVELLTSDDGTVQ
jgi:hypothetical protein